MMKELEYYLFREKIIKLIREFFINRNFHEVITPVLNDAVPLEPNIYPFETEWRNVRGTKKLYLSTSPEKNLKRMLALGIGNCFSIGHSFRNLESSSPLHSPEFLMLEWYRKNADYNDIMSDVKKLILFIQRKIKSTKMYNRLNDWSFYSLVTLIKKYAGFNLKEIVLDEKKLFEHAKKRGYQIKNTSWSELYDQIFVNEIELHLPKEPCFLIDFPSRISPLCKPKKKEPYLAERFELYINRIELANGNTENTNLKLIKKGLRKPFDYDFLSSLEKMKDVSYAGVGLGIDRLTMIFLSSNSIYSL